MGEGNYIKLDRKILEWEWYSDANTMRLFMHCLLKANWKSGKLNGVSIPRGSFATSYAALASQTKLSVRSIRTALKHLKTTGEVTSRTYHDFTIITVKNYNSYQAIDKPSDIQVTSKRQASDKQVTTIEERKNKRIKDIKNIYGAYKHVRLTEAELQKLKTDYGDSMAEKAITFLDEYIEMKGYKANSHYLCIRKWVVNAVKEREGKAEPAKSSKPNTFNNFEQRHYDYDDLETKILAGGNT